ncbi:hypothetical protein JCM1841_000438 [Sporobolomyces salmonicolor]
MHFPTFFAVSAAASSLAVSPASARLDRLTSAHRNLAARSHHAHSHYVVERDASPNPDPEPFRLFAKPDGTSGSFVARGEGVVALKERAEGLDALSQISDVVEQMATASKLAMPVHDRTAPVQLAAKLPKKASTASSSSAASKAAKKKAAAAEKKKEQAAAKAKAKAKKLKSNAKTSSKKKGVTKATVEKASSSKSAKSSKAASSSKASKAVVKSSSSSSKTNSLKAASSKSSSNKFITVLPPVLSLIGFIDNNCGESGASSEYPNGAESWLNCGISKNDPSSGWTPPNGVTLDHITTVSIEHALATNSVWKPCEPFIPLFEQIGIETGLPAILLAAFALQESTCNPNTMGDNGGAFGLMQITEDKCGGRNAKQCSEPEYNVRTAANYFKQELGNQNGAFLKALGAYNGWYSGLSYTSATAAAYGDCCQCQQNLDYLFQMTNGWLLGKTGYEMGSWKNLAVCGN